MQDYLAGKSSWKWDFLASDFTVSKYYTPARENDKTLQFESRFESGNLGLAVKITDQEYYLAMQNDTLTKGNTQCTILFSKS